MSEWTLISRIGNLYRRDQKRILPRIEVGVLVQSNLSGKLTFKLNDKLSISTNKIQDLTIHIPEK